MKNSTQLPLKRKGTDPIYNWEIRFGLNGLSSMNAFLVRVLLASSLSQPHDLAPLSQPLFYLPPLPRVFIVVKIADPYETPRFAASHLVARCF